MKTAIKPGATPATFDPQALYTKALRYIQNMDDYDSDEWEYALWSSLALEFLARAALANVSPALLAEADKNGSNLYFALGFTPFEERFSPKSISISEVFKRLSAILPEFTKEHESFGVVHTGKRNAELHTGELAFEGVKGSTWQPRFYQTCQMLLTSMSIPLDEFLGEEEAEVARKLIEAAADESAKAVMRCGQRWKGPERKLAAQSGRRRRLWGHEMSSLPEPNKRLQNELRTSARILTA